MCAVSVELGGRGSELDGVVIVLPEKFVLELVWSGVAEVERVAESETSVCGKR